MVATETRHQEIIDFYYERDNGYRDMLNVCVDNEYYTEYPFSYTIEEALEDYCTKQQWDFHHIQFGARIEENRGRGRFYYYRTINIVPVRPTRPVPEPSPTEPGLKQTHYSWTRYRGRRRIILATGESMYLMPSESVSHTLKELCMRLGWIYVSRNTYYSTYECGDGYMRYIE